MEPPEGLIAAAALPWGSGPAGLPAPGAGRIKARQSPPTAIPWLGAPSPPPLLPGSVPSTSELVLSDRFALGGRGLWGQDDFRGRNPFPSFQRENSPSQHCEAHTWCPPRLNCAAHLGSGLGPWKSTILFSQELSAHCTVTETSPKR